MLCYVSYDTINMRKLIGVLIHSKQVQTDKKLASMIIFYSLAETKNFIDKIVYIPVCKTRCKLLPFNIAQQ